MPSLSPRMLEALNKQVNHEMASAYNYLAMAGWFEHHNLTGFASWMQRQRGEELNHAYKLFKFVLDRGGQVDLAAVAKPKSDYKTPMEAFTKALEYERSNTKAIHELYALALEEKDYATQSHLKWFIDEQVEEEKVMNETESLLQLVGDNKSALLLLNQKLGERTSEQ